ncbi:MAG TPA: J domain-containing protein [Clostridiales bacterium]|jgi:hypothetical protein|nr:J domain-containing protein [Clostridiales bacterium]
MVKWGLVPIFTAELKRKLRQLKKTEARIRFGDAGDTGSRKYVWNDFFSLKDMHDNSVRYSMHELLGMDRQQLKDVFDEYFYFVYYQYYKENGIMPQGVYDINLLASLNLPPDASTEMIKKRFRELAKKYHPDHGGDSRKFISLVETYRKLTEDE